MKPDLVIFVTGNSVHVWSHEGYARHLYMPDWDESDETIRRLMLMRKLETLLEPIASHRYRTVVTIFGSPWVTYEKVTTDHARVQGFVYTPELEKQLLDTAYARIKKKRTEENQHRHHLLSLLVEERILNGYPVIEAYDREAHRVDVTMMALWVDTQIAHDCDRLVQKFFHPEQTLSLSYFQWLREVIMPDDFNGVVVMIGARTMQMMQIRATQCVGSHEIPVGAEHFFHTLAQELGTTVHSVRSDLIRAFENHLHPLEVEPLDRAYQHIRKEITHRCVEGFYALREGTPISGNVWIIFDHERDFLDDCMYEDEIRNIPYTRSIEDVIIDVFPHGEMSHNGRYICDTL